MFIKKDANKNNGAKNNRPTGVVSTIAAGTTINGDIESDSDMRIDGNVIGNIYCKAKIVLGESGIVQGNLSAAGADIFGTVNGHVTIKDLVCLKTKSTVNGDLNTKRLQIEPNATFNGKCTMTGDQPQATGSKTVSEKKVEFELNGN